MTDSRAATLEWGHSYRLLDSSLPGLLNGLDSLSGLEQVRSWGERVAELREWSAEHHQARTEPP